MKLRTIITTFLLSLMAVPTIAQTQQGFVKTKGRMVNGKHVPGKGLAGAVVTVKGQNALHVQQANGSFSFPTSNKQFFIQSVIKHGYDLVDTDAAPKGYVWSTNPFILLLETPQQQAEDKMQAERKIRRTLQRQLQQREDEIEELKSQNKLSQEEYQKALQQLYEDQKNNEKLIAEMAKQYSEMDYDQMDSLNQRISDCILNGELTRADSLLRSKGDINSRIAQLQREQQVISQRETEIARQQQELDAAKDGNKKKLEDIANDCKQFFDRFKIANQHDSAMYYIELRAELDTTNAEWQYDAGFYCAKQNQFREAVLYNERALRQYRYLAILSPQAYEPDMAMTLNNLASLYYKTQRFTESEQIYKEALEIRRRLASSNPQAYKHDVARTLNNLANLYGDTQRFTESEQMYKEVLEICRRLGSSNLQAYEPDVAMTLNNLATLYDKIQRFTESEQMYREALEIRRRLASSNPQAYKPDVAMTLNNLANLYSKTQRFTESEQMHKEALEISRHLASSNPQAYEPDVAMTLNNLATFYDKIQRFTESEQMYREALEIRRRLASSNLQAYEPDVARTLSNLASLYRDTQRFTESEQMYKEALEIRSRLASSNPQAYEPYVATTYGNMMLLYAKMNQWDNYDAYLAKALELYRKLYSANPTTYKSIVIELQNRTAWRMLRKGNVDEALVLARENLALDETNEKSKSYLASCLNDKACQYANASDFVLALSTIDEAISFDPKDANLYESRGEILLMQGKEQEALTMWRKVLELNPDFLKKYPNGTNLSKGLKERGLIE